MTESKETLFSILLTYENAIIYLAVWVLLITAQKVFPEFFARPIMVRMLPALPIVLCLAALWLPDVAQASMGTGDKILLGIVLGFAVGHVHKLISQAGLGKDTRLTPLDK